MHTIKSAEIKQPSNDGSRHVQTMEKSSCFRRWKNCFKIRKYVYFNKEIGTKLTLWRHVTNSNLRSHNMIPFFMILYKNRITLWRNPTRKDDTGLRAWKGISFIVIRLRGKCVVVSFRTELSINGWWCSTPIQLEKTNMRYHRLNEGIFRIKAKHFIHFDQIFQQVVAVYNNRKE